MDEESNESDEESVFHDTFSTFDHTIVPKHEYLGSDFEELHGRTIYDEDSLVWIPLLPEVGVVLVPGQILPLNVFYPPTVSMLREAISKDKIFGVLYDMSPASRANLLFGTTAEIFQFQEEDQVAGFKLKARGSQRFQVMELVRPGFKLLRARVKILPEVLPSTTLQTLRSHSLDRHRKSSDMIQTKIAQYDTIVTIWPEWVHKMYNAQHLVKKVKEELKNLNFSLENMKLPSDPICLSYWSIQCLPIDDHQRIQMLKMDCAIERLQFILYLLNRVQILYCVQCARRIGDRRDIFSMSSEGPQGTYCNPGGHIHETLTLYKAVGLRLSSDTPTTEYSWFPGYAWTIASCAQCAQHMGWCFTAVKSDLKPSKFWGLSKRSLTTHGRNWADPVDLSTSLLL